MKIKLSRVVKDNEEVNVVTALRAKAAEHVKNHLENPDLRSQDPAERPVELWTAKLLLECAELFQKTSTPEDP